MPKTPDSKKLSTPLALAIVAIIAIIVVACAYTLTNHVYPSQRIVTSNSVISNPTSSSSTPTFLNPAPVAAATFAVFIPTSVSVKPQIPVYSVKPDLSNITNLSDFINNPVNASLIA